MLSLTRESKMNDSNSPATDEITGLPTMAEANPIPTKVVSGLDMEVTINGNSYHRRR